MPNFLLTAQTLLSLCSGTSNAATIWFGPQDTDQLRVSVISIAKARDASMQMGSATERTRLDAAMNCLLASIKADAGAPLAFELGHAQAWQALIPEPTLAGLGVSDKQIFATAMHDGLTVVGAIRVLSLTGGGYRGLFTAQVLVDLCDLAGRRGAAKNRFALFLIAVLARWYCPNSCFHHQAPM